ncbi:hypothetical protein EON76_05035 [bacterium]|nr:MAG: hypothetical protein EON76_05035 [bacterium]
MESNKNISGEKALDKYVTELLNSEHKELPDSFFHTDIGGVALNAAAAENIDAQDPKSPKAE